jgi:hypothetical protein
MRRDILPIPLVELDLGLRRLINTLTSSDRNGEYPQRRTYVMSLVIVWVLSVISTMLLGYKNEPDLHKLSKTLFVQYLRRNVANTAGK